MNQIAASIALGCILAGTSWASTGQAQSCNYFAGSAVNGQSVNVDLCSISIASVQSVNFVYYLGNERIESQANCQKGTWTTFPEKQVNRPQSQATQRMLNVVCSYRTAGRGQNSNSNTALVFDPPSNVRTAPNGSILCTVKAQSRVNTYGSTGSWYYTDACGTMGVIHSSQVRF